MSTRVCRGVSFSHRLVVYAADRGQKEIVDILLRADACVDDTDANGGTACHVAATLLTCVCSLRLAPTRRLEMLPTPTVQQRCTKRSIEIADCVVLLLAGGASVCARDNGGRTTLLRVALLTIDLAIVHAFLAAGADVDQGRFFD
jgi:ankyrin repeat protein